MIIYHSAFIQWFGWKMFRVIAIPRIIGSLLYDCTYLQESEVSMILSLL